MKRDGVGKDPWWSVTFEMPGEIEAEALSVVGDFNGWGSRSGTDEAAEGWHVGRDDTRIPGVYHFRYVTGGGAWHDDPAADGYEPSGLGVDNCLLYLAAE